MVRPTSAMRSLVTLLSVLAVSETALAAPTRNANNPKPTISKHGRPAKGTTGKATAGTVAAAAAGTGAGAAGCPVTQANTAAANNAGLANAKAIYFMTNDAANSVVALKVGADGKLSDGSVTCAGGAGANGIENGAPAQPDSLFSQSALRVGNNMVVAVNPGSNTVSAFNIDPADPTKLTMAGAPQDTLGEFPVSVAISDKLKMACVANGGAKAGIACYSMSAAGLKPLDTALRPFDIGQTTPPVGPVGTVSHTFFNEDSSALLTTVKGDGKNNTGFLSVFPVENGAVSTKETRSSPAGTAVLFGSVNVGGNDVLATDASVGAAVLTVDPTTHIATTKSTTKIGDQKATCWAALSPATGTVFVTDVAVNHIVEIDPKTGTLVKSTDLTNGNPGLIDLAAAGNFVYALSPGKGAVKTAITVMDVSGGKGSAKEIQNFNPATGSANAMGMTALL